MRSASNPRPGIAYCRHCLTNLGLASLALAGLTCAGVAQTQNPPRLLPPVSEQGHWVLEWQGYQGRTYFPQYSGNLSDWSYSTKIHFGTGLKQHEPASIPNHGFFRLEYADRSVTSLEEAELADFDSDGLTNLEEVRNYGTNPLIADSDGDLLPDGWEVAHSLNPADDGTKEPGRGPHALFRAFTPNASEPTATIDGAHSAPQPVTNLDAFLAGVQAHPNATMSDQDGDGIPDQMDADPRSRAVDWLAKPKPSYIALPIPDWNFALHSIPLRINARNEVLTARALWRNDQWHLVNGNFSSTTIGPPLPYRFLINGRQHDCRLKFLQLSSLGNDGLILGNGTISIDHLTEVDPETGEEITHVPGHSPKFCFIWSDPATLPEIVNRISSQLIHGEFHDEDGMMASDGSLILRKKTGGSFSNLWNLERHQSVYHLVSPERHLGVSGLPVVRPGPGGFAAFGNIAMGATGQPSIVKSWVWETGQPVRSLYSTSSLSNGEAPAFNNFTSWIGNAPGGKPCISLGGITFILHEGRFHQVDTLHSATHMTTSGTAVVQATISHPLIWNSGFRWLLKDCIRNLGPADTTLRVIDSNDQGTMLVIFNENLASRRLALLMPMEIVPDFNRDGKINDSDRGRVTQGAPWRWWVNDDDDWSDGMGGDIPGASSPDHSDHRVDGMRDLIDFFPLHLDLAAVLKAFPTNRYEYYLKHSEEAFKFFEFPAAEPEPPESRSSYGPAAHFMDVTRGVSLSDNSVKTISAAGEKLSDTYLFQAKDGKGIILLEAVGETDLPLQLEMRRNGEVIAVLDFPVKTSKVEKMYRHVDLTQVPKNYDGSSPNADASPCGTVTTNPGAPYPDLLTNGKYFVFIHGFNVTPDQARGWNSETFKRMHQMGSRARFVGVVWTGATGIPGIIPDFMTTDYHKAAFFAFQTGDALKGALSFTTGADVTVAAHSLGNIVASQAIAGSTFTPSRYYLLNGAVPKEAYDPGSTQASESFAMTEKSWKPYGALDQQRLYAANWHNLFDSNDKRSQLKWKGVFSSVITEFGNAQNFYSTGEDVVQNPEFDDVNVWREITLTLNDQGGFVRGTWAAQEFVKGGTSIAIQGQTREQGGWGFHYNPSGLLSINSWDAGYWKNPLSPRRYTPEEARDEITDVELTVKPFFLPFLSHALFDPESGSSTAATPRVRYDLLASGIPSTSYAIAANPVTSMAENYNLSTYKTHSSLWPTDKHEGRAAGQWLHSDFKDVAINYHYKLFAKMIQSGNLDQ